LLCNAFRDRIFLPLSRKSKYALNVCDLLSLTLSIVIPHANVLTSRHAPLVHQSGIYTWGYVGSDISTDIAQFPTLCYFNLYPNRASDGQGVLGGNFTMASTSGDIKTWAHLLPSSLLRRLKHP
jgi:hypothetical protein